ncbi:hypothetical protein OW763_09245 [Clostridium aestuarii]|uniref:SbsA Ig-like domain-containing protein n=1 Tax=Clostridium aestuarii TaxID=338193 RepID=A0ABT4CZW6_9CLOT|nr:hypothetical protein [Clostridium aestuarii]MCY6484524.1 hypothetical protein [Clostridium aestuarii]
MNRKKILLTLLLAIGAAGICVNKAFAEIPKGTIVIGQNAYSIYYANDSDNRGKIKNLLKDRKDVFIKDFNGKWSDENGKAVKNTSIPQVRYIDEDSNVVYAEDDGDIVDNFEMLEVKSVKPLGSRYLQVELEKPVDSVDKFNFLAEDENGKVFELNSAKLAKWDSSNKTVVIYLDKDTETGKLYKVNSVNFAGMGKDSTSPRVNSIKALDYNKMQINFSMPVIIDDIEMEIKDRNNNEKLGVNKIAYLQGDPSKVVVTTEQQKNGVVYNTTIEDAHSFTRQRMYRCSNMTFVGIMKDTYTKLEVVGAEALDPNHVKITFNTKISRENVSDISNYFIEEVNGWNAEINIKDAEVKDEKSIVLTIKNNMKDITLYKIGVRGLKTSTGVELNTNVNTTTFVGVAPYTTKIDMSDSDNIVKVLGNRKIRITFERNMDKSTLKTENFYITTMDENMQRLYVENIDVIDDKNIELTISNMQDKLYKIEVYDLRDRYGNGVDENKNAKVFKGEKEAEPIKAVTDIKFGNDYSTLILTFNSRLDENVENISKYVIDNGVGYPLSAEVLSNDRTKLKLTIPKTVEGKAYKITMRNLDNIDGKSMGVSELTAIFIGRGRDAIDDLPKLLSAEAKDKQTLYIEFDRDVTDDKIDGVIWDSKKNELVEDSLVVDGDDDEELDDHSDVYAYQNPDNKKVLVIRISDEDFDKDDADKHGRFTLKAKGIDKHNDEVKFKYSSHSIEKISITRVEALDNKTIRVTFNQPVEIGKDADFARIAIEEDVVDDLLDRSDYDDIDDALNLSKPAPVDDKHKVYDFAITNGRLNSGYNWLVVNPDIDEDEDDGVYDYNGSDMDGFVTLKDKKSSQSGIQQYMKFRGSDQEPGVINNIQVVMKDSKTIEVYYPEAMNYDQKEESAVINMLNYKLVDRDGKEIVPNFFLIHTADMEYDEEGENNHKLTIRLNAFIPQSDNGYYIKFNKKLKNLLKTKNVQMSQYNDDEYKASFILSTKQAEGVKFEETKYDYKERELTIKLNQKVKSVTTYSKSLFLTDFEVNFVTDDGESYKIIEDDIENIKTTITNSTGDDTIVVTLKEKLIGNRTVQKGKIGKIKLTQYSTLKGVNEEKAHQDQNTVFLQ